MAVSDLGKARRIKAEQERAALEKARSSFQVEKKLEAYQRVDLPLLFLTIVLISYGLIMLFSSSLSSAYADWGDPLYYVRRQVIFTILGVIAIVVLQFISINLINNIIFAGGVYGVSTIFLLLVMLVGVEGDYGATRWLELGPIQFQPSELSKVAAIYCLATYFPFMKKSRAQGRWARKTYKEQRRIDALLFIVIPAVAMGLWLVLIAAQPHFSGAIILSLIVFSLFIAADIPWRIWRDGIMMLLPLLLIVIILLTLVYPLINHGESFLEYLGAKFKHVTSRLETFSNPDQASRDSMHQTQQARYALGSGGLLGKGLGMGQQKSGFLPMVFNDFIMGSIGEELGFLGSVSIIVLFFLFFMTGVKVTHRANSQFASLLAWGSTILITVQALMNIGVAAEVIPPTGISLPFFSYGGSSQIFFLIAVGFILQVSKQGQKVDARLRKIIIENNQYQKSFQNKLYNASEQPIKSNGKMV